jgi:hypothetical protein
LRRKLAETEQEYGALEGKWKIYSGAAYVEHYKKGADAREKQKEYSFCKCSRRLSRGSSRNGTAKGK